MRIVTIMLCADREPEAAEPSSPWRRIVAGARKPGVLWGVGTGAIGRRPAGVRAERDKAEACVLPCRGGSGPGPQRARQAGLFDQAEPLLEPVGDSVVGINCDTPDAYGLAYAVNCRFSGLGQWSQRRRLALCRPAKRERCSTPAETSAPRVGGRLATPESAHRCLRLLTTGAEAASPQGKGWA